MPEDFNEQAFQEEVIDSDRPVLIDFWAPWCQPCQMMMPLIDQAAVDYEQKIKVIKVNISDNEEAARRFNIMGVPTLISFVNGQEQARLVGLQSPGQIKEMIEKMIE